MKITYLDHSGFAVECGDTLLVFDEYNPKPAQGKSGLAGGVVTEADVRAHAHSALLLSHSHSDHYCKEVLTLPFESTVLSPDFPKRLSGTRLAEGESAALPGLAVRAFGSTDMGVSYLADLPGARIFHAGDYNLWHGRTKARRRRSARRRSGSRESLRPLLLLREQSTWPFSRSTRAWGRTPPAARNAFWKSCARKYSSRCTARAMLPCPKTLSESTRTASVR